MRIYFLLDDMNRRTFTNDEVKTHENKGSPMVREPLQIIPISEAAEEEIDRGCKVAHADERAECRSAAE
jgi:hypothetical protein